MNKKTNHLLTRRKLGPGLLLLLLPTVLLCSATSVMAFKCTVTASAVSFGGYDALSPTPAASTGSIGVTCNIKAKNPQAPLAVDISINAGNSGSFFQRYMMNASGEILNYNLYQNAGGTTIWGDGTGGSNNRIVNVTKETPYNGTIYGRIPAGQNVPVGSYNDLLTVTVLW